MIRPMGRRMRVAGKAGKRKNECCCCDCRYDFDDARDDIELAYNDVICMCDDDDDYQDNLQGWADAVWNLIRNEWGIDPYEGDAFLMVIMDGDKPNSCWHTWDANTLEESIVSKWHKIYG